MTFTGTNWIDLGANYQAVTNMTVMCWLTRDSTGSRDEIISKEGAGANGWTFAILASNVVEFGNFNVTYPVVQSVATISASTLYHVAAVRDASAALYRVFINGVQDNTAGGLVAPSNSSNNLFIGQNPVDPARPYGGVLQDVRFYNTAVSAARIAGIYGKMGTDKDFDGMQSRWLLNEGAPGVTATGAVIIDSGLGDITGTTTGSPTWENLLVRERAKLSSSGGK